MAVIEKRELQEDGHYQVSLYDEEKQKLVHRWSENKNGKKDGEEIELFEGTDEIRRKTNWKDGKKDGAEEIYQYVDCLYRRETGMKKYHSNTKIMPQEINVFNKGELISSEKYSYPRPTIRDAFLKKTPFAKAGLDLNEVKNPVIIRDGLTDEIKRITFDTEHGGWGCFYCHKAYDMNFKNGIEYNGYCNIPDKYSEYGNHNNPGECSYKVEKGLLTGCIVNRKGEEEYYEKGILTKIYNREHGLESFSYNEKGELDGPNICKNDHGETCKECTYRNGKLDGKYIETPKYNNRTVDCNYKDGKLDGAYFEETKDIKIECSYKDGNLDGEYKEYKKDKHDRFVLVKECSYKNGILDGEYKEYPNFDIFCDDYYHRVDYICNLIYKDGKIDSGKRYEYGDTPGYGKMINKLYEYENEAEYICTSYEFYANNRWGVTKKEHFKNDKLDGECRDYVKGTTTTYKNGKKDGLCSEPADYGRKKSIYKDDVLDGAYTEYFKNGKKRCEGSYSNGEKNGFWKTYADNGDLIAMRRYENGKDVTEHYNKLKNIAAKHIAKEDKRSEGKDERVVLKRKTKLGKAIDVAKESIKEKLHDR